MAMSSDLDAVLPPAPPRERPIIVQKYGGSSLADLDRLAKVADRVVDTRRAGHDVVVVVSAMGKTTDQLLELAQRAAATGVVDRKKPPRRELDMLVSTGERVAMALLSIAIEARGLDAISFTGSQCGILTNDRHFDASIIEVRPHRIADELARGRVVIVAGYQGMSYRREITTLGRGGSDTTAVALAAALEAERCEIYSDVDGVYSADPRVVPEARHLGELDYATIEEMATAGAKVLCAQAVEWARRAGIAIHARSTFDAAGGRETVVRAHADASHVRAVACDAKIALCELDAARVPELCTVLHEAEIGIAELGSSGGAATVLLSVLNAPGWTASRPRLEALSRIRDDVARVTVIGAGTGDRPDAIRRFDRALRAAAIAPLLLSAGALRISAVVHAGLAEQAQRALHATFA
jgi:aspartate kinase